MKTIKYILLAICFSILLHSCIDLTREDYTEIYDENFFQNENDLKLATNKLYNAFGTNWGSNDNNWANMFCSDRYGYHVFTEMTTDALMCTWGWEWDALHLHQWYAEKSGGEMDIFWTAFQRYNFLSSARNTIRKIEASNVSEDVKKIYAAEARALRGWMGLYLYDLFGTVPVASDEVLDNPQNKVYLARLSEEEYEKFMEDDLLKAIEDLPEIASARGRMTKGAARMILLKYYMIKKDFTKAEKIARDLLGMEGSVYNLQNDYNYVFSKQGIGNNEIILAIPCNVNYMPNYWTAHSIPDDYPYPVEGAQIWGAYLIPWDFMDTFESDKDERLKNIITSYTNKSGTYVSRGNGRLTEGAVPAKYGIDNEMLGNGTGIDIVVYRFSDVLLTLAECINENTGSPNSEAVELVNRVRRRAKIDELPASATASKQAFNDAILLERGHEFYGEGLRRQDLIRHGKYISSAQTRPGNQTDHYKVKFPIPVEFISESMDKIIQNPDY